MLTGVVKAAFDASHVNDYEPRAHRSPDCRGRAAVRADALRHRDLRPHRSRRGARSSTSTPATRAGRSGRRPAANILRLESTGPFASAAFPDARWEQPVLECAPGDALLLFTDGLSERGKGDEPFGEERILAEIGRHRDGGGALLDALLDGARRFTDRAADDDLTLITAKLV